MDTKKAEVLDVLYEKKATAAEIVKNYMIDFAVIIAIIIYVARAVATIEVANKSWLEVLADGCLIFFFATMISQLMQKKGLLEGEKDPRYIATLTEYGKTIEETMPIIEGLDKFCDDKNRANFEKEQARILLHYGISLDTFKAGFGNEPTEKQTQALEELNHLKIHELTTQELVSESGQSGEKFSLGRTQADYVKKKNVINTLMSIVTALILGYFTLKLVQDFSWALLIWSLIQVLFFIVKAVMAYASAFLFIVNDFRNRLLRKMSLIQEFINTERRQG